ncbi:MAG: hypothetical protein HC933_18250 [Pleurocapsa sp. SU_196_0]|nr:hypothetical protein [Pleurocapsa sp. SU_196_0]
MKRWLGTLAVVLGGMALAQTWIGSFAYTQKSDPLNDEDRSIIATFDREAVKGREAWLQWRCQKNSQSGKTDLFIALQHGLRVSDYAAYGGRVWWQYRFDKQTASSEWLSYFSEDGSRVYLTDEARRAFIEAATKAQKLVVVLSFDGAEPQTFSFVLDQYAEARAKLKCDVLEK